MAKVTDLKEALEYLKGLAPGGFFSTTGERIRQAPMEQAPAEEWATYLKPGQMVKRGGIDFPVKKEEVGTLLEELQDGDGNRTKEELLRGLQIHLPEIRSEIETPSQFKEYSYPSESYIEDITKLQGLFERQGHYAPDTLSWSRVSKQPGGIRLVEEIQSDVAQEQRKKRKVLSNLEEAAVGVPGSAERIKGMRGELDNLPFEDTKEYARLELSKQLINAADEGDNYLALPRGRDQVARYGMEEDEAKGMEYVYDKIYPSVLKKLGKKYGAKVVEVPNPYGAEKKIPALGHYGSLDLDDFIEQNTEQFDAYGELEDWIAGIEGYEEVTESMVRDIQYPAGIVNLRTQFMEAKEWLEKWDEKLAKDPDLSTDEIDPRRQKRFKKHLETIRIHMKDLERQYKKENKVEGGTFPALELTPEVRKKIQEIGVPLFTTGAIGVGLNEDEEQGFQEGGRVESGLGQLRRALESLPAGMYKDPNIFREFVGLSQGETPEDLRDLDVKRLKQLASGLSSQWMGMNPETGRPEFAGWPGGIEPGIIDELKALPTLSELWGGTPPEWASEAAGRSDVLREGIRKELGIGDPEGFMENLAESGGVMGGQIPIPAGWLSRLKTGKIVKDKPRLRQYARKIAEAPIEWLSPIVDPKLSNYTIGTLFGTGMGMLGELGEESPTGGPSERDLLEDMMTELEEQGYARGGKVSSILKLKKMWDLARRSKEDEGVFDGLSTRELKDYEKFIDQRMGELFDSPAFNEAAMQAGGEGLDDAMDYWAEGVVVGGPDTFRRALEGDLSKAEQFEGVYYPLRQQQDQRGLDEDWKKLGKMATQENKLRGLIDKYYSKPSESAYGSISEFLGKRGKKPTRYLEEMHKTSPQRGSQEGDELWNELIHQLALINPERMEKSLQGRVRDSMIGRQEETGLSDLLGYYGKTEFPPHMETERQNLLREITEKKGRNPRYDLWGDPVREYVEKLSRHLQSPLTVKKARGGKVGPIREGLKYLLGLDKLETPDPNLPATVEPQLPAPVDPQTALMEIAAQQINKPVTRRELLKGAAQKAVQSQLAPLQALEKLSAPTEKAKTATRPAGFLSKADFSDEQMEFMDYNVDVQLEDMRDWPEDYAQDKIEWLKKWSKLPKAYLFSEEDKEKLIDVLEYGTEDLDYGEIELLPMAEEAIHRLAGKEGEYIPSAYTMDGVLEEVKDTIFETSDEPEYEHALKLLKLLPGTESLQKDLLKGKELMALPTEEFDVDEMNDYWSDFSEKFDEFRKEKSYILPEPPVRTPEQEIELEQLLKSISGEEGIK